MNIFKHNVSGNSFLSPDNIGYGELAIDYVKKQLFTKNLNSGILPVRSGLNKLAELEDTDINVFSNSAFLQFNEERNLESFLLNIGISELEGTDIYFRPDTYLGYNSSLLVEDLSKPVLSLMQLADIDITQLNADVSNYTVTYRHNIVDGDTGKDPFQVGEQIGLWYLMPEASQILDFDEFVGSSNPKNDYVIANSTGTTPSGSVGRADGLTIAPMSIIWDDEPELGNNLEFGGFAAYAIQYSLFYKKVTTASETVVLDTLTYDCFIIDCENTIQLSFDILKSGKENHLDTKILILKNFEGLCSLPPYVTYENGIPPVLLGRNNILNLLVYGDTVHCIQKINNYSKVK